MVCTDIYSVNELCLLGFAVCGFICCTFSSCLGKHSVVYVCHFVSALLNNLSFPLQSGHYNSCHSVVTFLFLLLCLLLPARKAQPILGRFKYAVLFKVYIYIRPCCSVLAVNFPFFFYFCIDKGTASGIGRPSARNDTCLIA